LTRLGRSVQSADALLLRDAGPPCEAGELSDVAIASLLTDASLVFFDGRLAECALRLGTAAVAARVPVLCEAERLRPGLEELLALADVVVTDATAWTQLAQTTTNGTANSAQQIVTLDAPLQLLPGARVTLYFVVEAPYWASADATPPSMWYSPGTGTAASVNALPRETHPAVWSSPAPLRPLHPTAR
jgi:hypothetical protein